MTADRRHHAWTRGRIFCHLLGPAMAWHSRRIALCHECFVRVEVASGIEATAHPLAGAQTRMAWGLDGASESDRQCPTPYADLRGCNARLFFVVIGVGTVS